MRQISRRPWISGGVAAVLAATVIVGWIHRWCRTISTPDRVQRC